MREAVRLRAFGHVWVVLSVVVRLPFSRRPWALPVLFRLYRSKKECARHRGRYRKKTELTREMIEVLLSWTEGRRVRVSGDSAYSNWTVLHGLTSKLSFVGAMRPDAALTAVPAAHPGRGVAGFAAKACRARSNVHARPEPS